MQKKNEAKLYIFPKVGVVETLFFAALAAMIVTVSCQKENIDSVNEELVFTASIVDSQTKTTINTDSTDVDNRGKISWVKGDQITITDASKKSAVYVAASDGQTVNFTKKAGETDLGVGPYTATYGTAPLTTQSYDDYYSDANVAKNIYMTASTSSTTSKELTFTAACGLLRLNLTAADSETTKNISKIEIMGTPDGDTTATIYTLDCSTAKDISSAKEFYLALPKGSYSVMKFTNSTGHICFKTAKTAMEIADNTVQPATIAGIVFNDLLPGKFEVSTGKHVKFSRGNLRAKKVGETWTWGFYNNQYDLASATPSADELSLFTWGAQTGEGTAWRSLSGGVGGEWAHLLSRNKGNCCQTATVNSVFGLVIYPDGFTPQGKSNFSASEWAILEAEGCVFLPAAGYHDGFSICYAGTYGLYWSSSPYESDTAYDLFFYEGEILPANNDLRSYGLSVRFVTSID